MNCKPGDLAVVVRAAPHWRCLIGRIVVIGSPCPIYPGNWDTVPPLVINGRFGSLGDGQLRPIRDQPGNESWFKAAPLSLPPKPVQTAPQTNTNRSPESV